MNFTFDERIVSDLHKDAYGFRPSVGWWSVWNELNPTEKQCEWDRLLDRLEEENDRERREQERALADFERRIKSAIDFGAPNTETAIRWIVQSEELDEVDLEYGASYLCWKLGLSYQNPHVKMINTVMRNMVLELEAA